MSPHFFETDVVIIGAGPTGLFAIFEAGMLKMQAHVIDTLDTIGGQCAALYPQKPIYDIPAHPAIDAMDLVKQLEAQAAPFKPIYHLGQRVERVSGDMTQGFTIITSAGTTIRCKVIIIAGGCGAFGPNRPPLPDIEAYEGKSVFYHVGQRELFADKTLVIAGGGDSAVDWTLLLAEKARKIYVIHRRAKFRSAPESVARMEALAKSGKVELVVPYQLTALSGKEGNLENVIVSTLEGQQRVLLADILLPFFGLAMELGPIAKWGLHLSENHITVDPATMATNVPGIFACGDIAHYPGKLKLILCGFAEAAMACHAMYPLVNTGHTLHFEYSTNKGIPA